MSAEIKITQCGRCFGPILAGHVCIMKDGKPRAWRVYVASAFEDFQRTRAVMAQLRNGGWTVTFDWTAMADIYPTDNAPLHERAKHARADLQGVRDADVVLVLTPTDKSKGCGMWWEAGAAAALGKPVVISGPQRGRSVFCELGFQVETDELAVEMLLEQPVMGCPSCDRLFFDFDGCGVLWCDEATGGCGHCTHASCSGGNYDFPLQCDICGELCGEREARP